jgi:deoxyribonuclease-4
MQIFTKNATRWDGPPLDPGEVARFREEAARTGIAPVFAHDSYLINLASPDPKLLGRSRRAFLGELERAEALGLSFVVTHPGAHTGSGEQEGLLRVAESIDWLDGQPTGRNVRICLENTAGQGTVLAGEFGHFTEIFARVRRPERLGVCLDTCHAHAAGYDLGGEAACRATLEALDRAVGLDRLLALHLNDAKGVRGGHLDRHEHIGWGAVGLECFRVLMNDERLQRVPKVIETPKEEGGVAMDPVNLGVLRALHGADRVPPALLKRVAAARSGAR